MTPQPTITLNDGHTIPQLGLGVWQALGDAAREAVRTALEVGYRHIDTASIYKNEAEVGRGLQDSGIPRDQVFLTTKLWNDDQGFQSAFRACDESLERLKTDYIDLYLIHWPAPRKERFVETWKAMIRLRDDGRVRSIGVSNFPRPYLQRLIDETGVVPAVNQIELHPRFQERALREANAALGIATESWSPLGRGAFLNDPVLAAIGRKHGRSPAQVILRWHLQNGLIVIPKSVTPKRIEENFSVFDFTLDHDDLAAIDAMDSATGRQGPDPMTAAF